MPIYHLYSSSAIGPGMSYYAAETPSALQPSNPCPSFRHPLHHSNHSHPIIYTGRDFALGSKEIKDQTGHPPR